MSETNSHIWAFDLGLGSIGEAVREGNKFLHKASLLIPADFAETKTAAGRRRMWRTRQAHKAREAWLDEVMRAAGIEPLQGRQMGKVDEQGNPIPKSEWKKKKGKWVEIAKGDYRLEREFAPPEKDKDGKLIEYRDGKARDGSPAATKKDFETCYTSCLLRIKLLEWKEGDQKLEQWQIYKALHSAVQKRGYGKVQWAAKEAARQGMTPEELEKKEQADLAKKDPAYQAAVNAWRDFKKKVTDCRFHFPAYYDAAKMRLWDHQKPDVLEDRIRSQARSTRNVRFDREDVEKEIEKLANKASELLPQLRKAFDEFRTGGWRRRNGENGHEKSFEVSAKDFGEFLVHGPTGAPRAAEDADFGRYLAFRKRHGIHPGSDDDWMGATSQKTPRFDNRIIEKCALIPRLNVCRITPSWVKKPDGGQEIDPSTLLAAEVVFLLQLKNLQVDDRATGSVRFLKPAELREWLDRTSEAIRAVPISEGWQRTVVDCFKITKPQWNKWCREKDFSAIDTEGADSGKAHASSDAAANTAASPTDSAGADATQARGKTKDVVKAPKASGRSRFCRQSLAILRHLLLNDQSPNEFAKKLRAGDAKLIHSLGFAIAAKPPVRQPMRERSEKKRELPWLLFDDLAFLDFLWKAIDEKGKPSVYSPHQLRIPDMGLRHLRKEHGLTDKPYSELLRSKDTELKRRENAISKLIGDQNNPIVRDRLTRFWRRLQHFQNPKISPDPKKQKPGFEFNDPACLVLEFVRDDKDNSLDGQKRTDALRQAIGRNEERRERARKALQSSSPPLPASDEMIVRWMLWEDQGPVCIYTGQPLSCCDLQDLQIEHIVPRSLGGPDAYWNWVLCTESANAEKGNRIPYQWFQEEKEPREWEVYKRYIVDERAARLGRRKVDLLLRPDAAELVGEKYSSLAATAWVARLAQSIARLHFGWPLDDDSEKERVITISGGLTARIRRKYLLDSLLGSDEEAVKNRLEIDGTLAALEELKDDHSLEKADRKAKRDELRQKLQGLASESEKNRSDQRHHALDAMLLTFLPQWARDKRKEDFFRFDDIGDAPLYSSEGEQKRDSIRDAIRKLTEETAPVRGTIQSARKAEKWEAMNDLKQSIFPQRKRVAEFFQALDKLKQPRNIRVVREWFKQQLGGEKPVLPRRIAFQKTAVEATLYRRAYLIHSNQEEQSRIPLSALGFRQDFHDNSRQVFDFKRLCARIQSITDHKDYDRKKLKHLLRDKLKIAIATCQAEKRPFADTDWQAIAVQEDVRTQFPLVGRGKSASLAQASECQVKVCKAETLPVKRFSLVELAYSSGTVYVWNPEYFKDTTGKILSKREMQSGRRSGGRGKIQILKAAASPETDACPWPDYFLWDRETQTKLKRLQQDIEECLKPLLLGAKPKKMNEAEKEAWEKKEGDWEKAWDDFRNKHKLPKSLFLFTSESDRPPKRPNASLMRVLFERKDKIFSAGTLKKQADSVVDTSLRNCLEWLADSLLAVPDEREREALWKKFCSVIRVTPKKHLKSFLDANTNPSPKQWIEFYDGADGARVIQIEQIAGTGFEEYQDLSKDGTGQFAKAGGMGGKPSNEGYLICKKGDEMKAFPIRFFESKSVVEERLERTGWQPQDKRLWRSGELIHLERDAATNPKQKNKKPKVIPRGHYFLGSISNQTDVNLNTCLGGEIPKGISLKLLWEAGLRRAIESL